jgi:hypothetical protein
VDRPTYDHSIAVLRSAVERSKLGNSDRVAALRKLAGFERQGAGEPARSGRGAEVLQPRVAEGPQTELAL